MQLKTKKRGIASALGVMTAGLLAGTPVYGQIGDEIITTSAQPNHETPEPQAPQSTEFDDDTYTDEGLIRLNGAVLVYKEDGGRVQAIEPVVGVTYNFDDQSSLSLKFTADILTGASPYGATPWRETQTLIDPPSTGASGSKTNTVVSTNVPPDVLPLATGFSDQRYAVDIGYSSPWGEGRTVSLSGGVSKERDYKSFYGNVGYSQEFNQKNTTFTAAVNFEYDISSPPGGHPRPLSLADGSLNPENRHKTVIGGLVGISQVMNRHWLAQLNYNLSSSSGYHSDPYRVTSVVDGVTGGPVRYLYEARPDKRLRQSIYFGNKIAIGSSVVDASIRGYHDDWGINSATINLAVRIPITDRFYIKPGGRYYTQSAADFFNYYLVDGAPLPQFTSPDSRLDKFSAVTGSLMLGYKTSRTGELYLRFGRYEPSAKTRTTNAPGYLAGRDLFSGTASSSLVVGYTYAFR